MRKMRDVHYICEEKFSSFSKNDVALKLET